MSVNSPNPVSTQISTARLLINAGIFSAIALVCVFTIGLIGLAGPIFMFVSGPIGVFVMGIIFSLYVAKTPHFWAIIAFSVLLSAVYSMESIFVFPVGLLLGFCGDLIASSKQYRSPVLNSFAFSLFTVISVAAFIPLFLNSDAYYQMIAANYGAAYATQMQAIFSPFTVFILAIVDALVGFFGVLVGHKLLKKHFKRAGVA